MPVSSSGKKKKKQKTVLSYLAQSKEAAAYSSKVHAATVKLGWSRSLNVHWRHILLFSVTPVQHLGTSLTLLDTVSEIVLNKQDLREVLLILPLRYIGTLQLPLQRELCGFQSFHYFGKTFCKRKAFEFLLLGLIFLSFRYRLVY